MTTAETSKRRALLTGASRGIGAAIRTALEADGVTVATPSHVELNLSSPASIDAFLAKADAYDILINNAGINVLNPLEAIDAATWAEMVQVDLTAPLRLIQGLMPGMRTRRWGRIVNVSSVFSLVTREKRGAYSAVKSGLNGLTRTAAVELGPYGILVNAVCPGYVATEMTTRNNSPQDLAKISETIPLRRLAEPAEIARFVAFLASDQNTYITGQTLAIDGGFVCG